MDREHVLSKDCWCNPDVESFRSAPKSRVSQMKRNNHRQWFHRLIHAKCWNCNVSLVAVNDMDGKRCPMCLTFYNQTVVGHLETKRRSRWWTSAWSAES